MEALIACSGRQVDDTDSGPLHAKDARYITVKFLLLDSGESKGKEDTRKVVRNERGLESRSERIGWQGGTKVCSTDDGYGTPELWPISLVDF